MATDQGTTPQLMRMDVPEASPAPRASPGTPWALYTVQQRWLFLAILFLVSASNYADRFVIAVLLEPIKQEFKVSDTALGLLSGLSFAFFYATFGLPFARWADRGNRRTVITLALAAWSAMTVLCGMAQTFVQLLWARLGVGVGEAGANPPSQSLIVDYFPPEDRATAIGVLACGAQAGYVLAFVAGGYIAATYGWRAAFLIAGLPGLALALLTHFCIAEPRLTLGFPRSGVEGERAGTAIRLLLRKRSFVFAVTGVCLYTFMANGALIFVPSFLIRLLNVPLQDVSLFYGGIEAVAGLVGALGGGLVADRMARRDIRWLAWLPAGACVLTCPIFILAFSLNHFGSFLALMFITEMLLTACFPPIFAAVHAVCGQQRRATAIAILAFVASLLGGGLGPVASGALSDVLSVAHGAEGLRYALQLMMVTLLFSGAAFYNAAQVLPRERER